MASPVSNPLKDGQHAKSSRASSSIDRGPPPSNVRGANFGPSSRGAFDMLKKQPNNTHRPSPSNDRSEGVALHSRAFIGQRIETKTKQQQTNLHRASGGQRQRQPTIKTPIQSIPRKPPNSRDDLMREQLEALGRQIAALSDEHRKFVVGQDTLLRGQEDLAQKVNRIVEVLCGGGGVQGSEIDHSSLKSFGGTQSTLVGESDSPTAGKDGEGDGHQPAVSVDPSLAEAASQQRLESNKNGLHVEIIDGSIAKSEADIIDLPTLSKENFDDIIEESHEDSDDDAMFRAIKKFQLVDKDGSGGLDLDEMLNGGKILGLSKEDAVQLYNEMEKNSDGHVTLEAYLANYRARRTTHPHTGTGDGESLLPVLVEDSEWMVSPRSNFRFGWDLGGMMPLLLYLTIMLPFRLTFDNEPSLFSFFYWFEFLIDLFFIADMALNFRTGVAVETQNAKGEHYEAIEYDRKTVAMSYIKSWFFIDFFSGIPFSLIDLISNGSSPDNASSLKALRFLKLARLLKLGRLLKIEKILKSLDRDTLDQIEDFLTDGASLSLNSAASLILALAFVVHIMACGFVAVGKAAEGAGRDNWLNHEANGPFSSEDTTGTNGSGPVYTIYLTAFYFCLTTMTSVGYGDVIPRGNSERLFVIFLEFASSVVFATIIGLITAVVTSLDMGAKKKAEGLAEVSAFVSFRRFPHKLGRRIRRHFRNFYSLKTAMDEKKIFSTLSTTLRKDVSEFLVIELMGSESFFMTMSTTLWPRLLPLLHPMTFEAQERLCIQGEECEEMYVVINGVMTGTTHLAGDREPRVVRRLGKGDSVNVLCLIEIWYKCVETVVSGLNLSEVYAVKSEEFVALFQSDMDVKNFISMQQREVKKFHFVPSDEAPSELGMPLYLSCFSSIELKLVKVFGGILNPESTSANRLQAWVVIDLVDKGGRPFNDFWSHTTEHSTPKAGLDGTLELFCGAEIRWTDVSVSFDLAFVRFRVFVSDTLRGHPHVSASALMSLQYVHKRMPKKPRSQLLTAASDASAAAIGGASSHTGQAPSSPSLATLSASSFSSTSSSSSSFPRTPNSLSEHWESIHPFDPTTEVVAWCELRPARFARRGTVAASSSSSHHHSSHTGGHTEDVAGDGVDDVLFGDAWVGPPSASGVKLRARLRRPEKFRFKNAAGALQSSFVASSAAGGGGAGAGGGAEPTSTPRESFEQPSSRRGLAATQDSPAFLGTKTATGRTTLSRRTASSPNLLATSPPVSSRPNGEAELKQELLANL